MTRKTKGRFEIISPVLGAVTYQHIDLGGGKVINANLTGDPSPCEATITIINTNAISSEGSRITLGNIELIEGIHWEIAGNVNDTATNLADAIGASLNDGITGFSAVAVDADVTITGPNGPQDIVLELVDYTENLSLEPSTGVMSEGSPSITGPDF